MVLRMSSSAAALSEARPYHHGDLRRALLTAARKIMVQEGQLALSLRAVAREAGVSPAAPYHHFRDKAELLAAVAHEGFVELGAAMRKARDAEPQDKLTAMGVAYVVFSQENAALYRVMTECSRVKDSFPDHEAVIQTNPNRPYELVRDALIASGVGTADDEIGLHITTAALYCAAHGMAELADSDGFKPLIEAMGGKLAFYRAAFAQIGHLSGR